jgi:hypothetical protein
MFKMFFGLCNRETDPGIVHIIFRKPENRGILPAGKKSHSVQQYHAERCRFLKAYNNKSLGADHQRLYKKIMSVLIMRFCALSGSKNMEKPAAAIFSG